MNGAEGYALALAVTAEGDGMDDDAPELDTAEGYAAAYPAAAALAAFLRTGRTLHDGTYTVGLSRTAMRDAPWHVSAASFPLGWMAHDSLADACAAFVRIAASAALAERRAELAERAADAHAEWMAAGRPDTRDAARKRYRRARAALDALGTTGGAQ